MKVGTRVPCRIDLCMANDWECTTRRTARHVGACSEEWRRAASTSALSLVPCLHLLMEIDVLSGMQVGGQCDMILLGVFKGLLEQEY